MNGRPPNLDTESKDSERLPQLSVQCGLDTSRIQSTEVRSGEAADEICKAAAEGYSDLVVLASHG